ncbi:hypothetical protein KEM54_003925 [Ascosphaera aggregata]|nr:hypothetical protein KEM54_003925 [Ascosphaera aggregata]
MDALLEHHEELRKLKESGKNIECVDSIIELLTQARDSIAADPSTATESLRRIQDPVSKTFGSLRRHIKTTSRLHEQYSKQLDKLFKHTDVSSLQNKDESFTRHRDLLNKAITMHFLREGRFDVADTFVKEQEQEAKEQQECQQQQQQQQHLTIPGSSAEFPMSIDDDDIELTDAPCNEYSSTTEGTCGSHTVSSDEVREDFIRMYKILEEFRKHNLAPAIQWTDQHKKVLEKKGSNLAFELCRLQFLYLFQGSSKKAKETALQSDNNCDCDCDGEEDGDDVSVMQRSIAAIRFARENFHHYAALHSQEIKELVGAIPFSMNIADSPYASKFNNQLLWDETTQSFTREYCSVLGLSAESPLYIAATAGILSLSTFQKAQVVTAKTSSLDSRPNRIMSDVPLPKMYRFHPIFICPVMKDATTIDNPPALLPCGHVLSLQATEMLGKGGMFKCPYCPKECNPNLIRKLII